MSQVIEWNGHKVDVDRALMEITREECEESLYTFLMHAWRFIDPAPFKPGWVIDALAEHLEAVVDGDIKRLLINIPPRCSKPVAGTEMVSTQEFGLIPLSDVVPGMHVLTHKNRFRRVIAVHKQGVLHTLRLTTRRGRTIAAAPDHPFYTTDYWRELRYIKQDDRVGVVPQFDNLPSGRPTMSGETARLLGYLVGDGSCSGTPNITVADDPEAEDIQHVVRAAGFVPTEQSYRMANTGYMLRRIGIRAAAGTMKRPTRSSAGPVKQFMQRYGLWEKNSYTKRVPEDVMRGDDTVVTEFLGAYWACDGFITKKTAERIDHVIGCDSVSIDMLRDIQQLLLRLGIDSIIRRKTAKIKTKKQGDTYTSYSLTVSDQYNCWQFARRIYLKHTKDARLTALRCAYAPDFAREIVVDVVESVQPSADVECMCLTVDEDESFVVNGFAVHNSSICSVAFPAWVWAQSYHSATSGPGVPLLHASYAHSLALRDSVKSRRLIKSTWYQRMWGDRFKITPDQDMKIRFQNDKGGERMITSVDAGVTGEGGNIIVVDDPNNAKEVLSDAVIQSTNEDWWDGTMSTRLNDPKTGAFIVVQQRLGEDDLTGHILRNDKRGQWTHLCYDNQTEILTRSGWIPMPQLTEGIEVLGVDPATLKARWELPTRLYAAAYSGDMLAYKSDTADLLVTPDHRMVYGDVNEFSNGSCTRWRVRAAKDLPKHFYLPQVVKWGLGETYIYFGNRDWPSGAFAEFMGWYLSEGCASAKARTTRIVQKENGKHVADLERVLAAIPFHVGRTRRSSGMLCWTIKDRFLAAELAALGKSLTKRAPRVLKDMGTEELRAFLIAYAKGDGHFAVRNARKITIGTSSRQMGDDLQECAVKAGWAASLNVRHQEGGRVFNGYTLPPSTQYKLYIRASKVPGVDRKIASKIRKENISTVPYEGSVYCVTVPSTAIVVRRNGRVSVSGNCLPMEFEKERSFVTSIGWEDPRETEGELLWPERFGPEEVYNLKEVLHEWKAAGQLQQRPEPKGGGIIKKDWWQLWPPDGEAFDAKGNPLKPVQFPPCSFILASLDTAYTEKTINDPSALTIWGVFAGDPIAQEVRASDEHSVRVYTETSTRVILLHAWTKHLEIHPLVNEVAKSCKEFNVDKLLIEDKAAGHSVAQELRRLFSNENFAIQLINPKNLDKLARLYSVQHLWEEKMIYAPDRTWSQAVMNQCATFPNATHDDLVDTTSMAMRHMRDIGLLQRGVEITADVTESVRHTGRPSQRLYPS